MAFIFSKEGVEKIKEPRVEFESIADKKKKQMMNRKFSEG